MDGFLKRAREKKRSGLPLSRALFRAPRRGIENLRLMIDGLAGARATRICNTAFREGLQKGSVICKPQGGNHRLACLPRGKERDAMRDVGNAIMRRGWGGASSSRLRARLCFPGPSLGCFET